MGRIRWITGGLIVAGWMSAAGMGRAEPLLSFGPDIPLFVTASASIRRDSNVNLTPTDARADTIFVLAPGVDFHYKTAVVDTGITYSEQFVRYESKADSDLNGDLANVAGHFNYSGAETQVSAMGSYLQENQSTLSVTSINETVMQNIGTADLNLTLGLTAKTKVGAGFGFTDVTYPETGFDNNQCWSFPANLYYSVAPKLDLSVGYTRSRTTTANGTGDSDGNFYNVGGHGEFTPKLSGDLQIGITQNLPRAGSQHHESDLGLNAALNYELTPKLAASFVGTSGFTVSPAGTTEKALTLGVNATLALSDAWNVIAGGSYNDTQYLSVPSRTDHFGTGSIGLSYVWTTDTSFSVQYIYRKDDSTLTDVGFSDSIVSFTAASKF